MSEPIKLVAFCGSLRKASFNRLALHAFVERLPAGVTVETIEIDWPLYSADIQAQGFPAPVQAAQQKLLDDALGALDDERPGITDLYFVGFDADAREPALREDIVQAQHVMDERWDTRGRSVVLANDASTLVDTPFATVTHLRETLRERFGIEHMTLQVEALDHADDGACCILDPRCFVPRAVPVLAISERSHTAQSK